MRPNWPTGSYDVLSRNLVVAVCGLNPSVAAATTGYNFGAASNRFWRALHLAGFTPERLSAGEGRTLLKFGCGITAAIGRGTRTASELKRSDYRQIATAFEEKMAYYRPHTIAFLGKQAYGGMTGRRELEWGDQASSFAGACVWLLPNPSGLNRAFTLDRLVAHYARLRANVARELENYLSR